MSSNVLQTNELYSSMETGTPVAAYIKTILGKVAVTVWDNFTERPTEVILQGDPKRKDEGCIVKVWSDKENAYFKSVNRKHFAKGVIIPFVIPAVPEVVNTIEQSTDEELAEIVNLKFFALTTKLNKIGSVAVLFRMKNIAEDLDKSEKITGAIEKRISELQVAEYPQRLEVEVHPED